MSGITTHVLDTARGQPAAGVAVMLELRDPQGAWQELGRGATDADGRCRSLLKPDHALARGVYRITFETGAYFQGLGVQGFYPSVPVVFEIREPAQHYHVPLLLSPFGFSTYRGS
jgi:5-hydroxyisourate hydrolase